MARLACSICVVATGTTNKSSPGRKGALRVRQMMKTSANELSGYKGFLEATMPRQGGGHCILVIPTR
jgi:hypothetical protein